MAVRKTVPVKTVVEQANLLLALEDGPDPLTNRMFRRGVMAMVERVLFDTDNYRGFHYLKSEFVEEQPGMGLREGYDPTRINYYLPR